MTDGSGQQHVGPETARIVDGAIRRLSGRYADEDPVLVLADVAGVAEIKPVVAASCRYRFGPRSVQFVRPDLRRTSPVINEHLIPPDESLESRRVVAELLERGAFDVAAGVALPEATSESAGCEPWRAWLHDLARLLRGEMSEVGQKFKRELRPSAIHAQLRKILPKGAPLLAAFRVESALLRDDWSWAVRETFTFGDASRMSLIRRDLRRSNRSTCFDRWQSRLDPKSLLPSVRESLASRSGRRESYSLNKPDLVNFLVEQLPNEEHRRAVQSLGRAIGAGARFRNKATHGSLASKDIEDALTFFVHQGLWSTRPPHFLGQPLVSDTLQALGVADARLLWDGLLTAVKADMDAYSFLESPDLVPPAG